MKIEKAIYNIVNGNKQDAKKIIKSMHLQERYWFLQELKKSVNEYSFNHWMNIVITRDFK